jgi:outer membrane protein OmpA-like peptidoglycan-associated protein
MTSRDLLPLSWSCFLSFCCLTQSGCQTVWQREAGNGQKQVKEGEAVVYALGSREGFSSPLLLSGRTPALPGLIFPAERFELTSSHRQQLKLLSDKMRKRSAQRLVITSYVPTQLPEDHARALAERRAVAVREFLIQSGLEAARIQTLSFGADHSPNAPNSDVVLLYLE